MRSFILLLLPLLTYSQAITEQLILTDTPDSALLKAYPIAFDKEGNYMMGQPHGKHQFLFVLNDTTIGPLRRHIFSTVTSYSRPKEESMTYNHGTSPRIYGPYLGKPINRSPPVSKNTMHVADARLHDDKVLIYFDGELIHEIDTLSGAQMSINGKPASPYQAKKSKFESKDWIHFSNNGNRIYSLEDDHTFRLYLNGKVIDTSHKTFYQVRVNDASDYIYAKGRKPYAHESYDYDYMFFLHTPDSVFGPVRTAWDCYLMDHGGYYYSGDDAGPDYILINDHLYKDIDQVSDVTILDRKNFLFSYTKGKKKHLVVNGKDYPLNYDEIYLPTLDADGNFACYGMRDYYLYKFINGQEVEAPITNYGVRPIPLYISPAGESMHVFLTEDSIYLYRDEKLLTPPLAKDTPFSVINANEILPNRYERGKPQNGLSLLYLQVDTTGYMIYDGQLSKPMQAAGKKSWTRTPKVGEVVVGEFSEAGFYLIQHTGENSWLININNTRYLELEDVSRIFEKNCFFDGKELVFYGTKGLSFYRFSVGL